MNIVLDLMHILSYCFDHIVGDPTHTNAATAIKTTMQAGVELAKVDATAELSELGEKVESLMSAGRAVTSQEWTELKQLAEKHLLAAISNPAPPAAAPSVPANPPVLEPSAPSAP
jgi:hypothetical protein